MLSHHFGKPMIPWKDFITGVPYKAIIVYLWRDVDTKQPTAFVSVNVTTTEDVTYCINHSEKYSRPSFQQA